MASELVHQKDPHNMELFLDLIKDYPIILNCSKVPKIVAEKERAIEIVCKRFETDIGGNSMTKLKLLKKINNLKTRFKMLSNQSEIGSKSVRPWIITFANLLRVNGISVKTRVSGQEIIGSETTKREREESNEIFLDEISSHMDEDIDEDSISFTESVDPKQQKLQLNTTPFIEFTESVEPSNAKDKSKYYKKPKYVIPGETEETKWLTTKQLERMALIEHINFSKIQREYYAEKLKLMRKQK